MASANSSLFGHRHVPGVFISVFIRLEERHETLNQQGESRALDFRVLRTGCSHQRHTFLHARRAKL
jgi:hypothetical protein